MRVAFLHPDLGLGGAERLVVDAACELRAKGHQVDVYTAYHDPQRCFKETVDGTLNVKVHGGWFPRTFFGWKVKYDVIFVDQVSVVVPLLHCFLQAKILFYCHHPDLLLARRRPGLHRLYRWPLDWLEEVTTGQADEVLVNSKYTAEVFQATFARLRARKIEPGVLYPAVSIMSETDLQHAERSAASCLSSKIYAILGKQPTFLSINRFERKKEIDLAVRAYHQVLESKGELHQPPSEASCRLIIAGGCDKRLAENVEYWDELQALADSLGIQKHRSFTHLPTSILALFPWRR